jgi:Fe-S cluster biogenesis protein NfuA
MLVLPCVAPARFRFGQKELMAQDTALQKQIQRIGEIVEQLESTSDPSVRSMARELLESLMALHGAGLERILDLASQTGEAGATIIQKCGRDELVSSLLLLYGLHPDDLQTRVMRALEKSRSQLEKHGGAAELISVSEHGEIRVRLAIKAPAGCGSSATSLKSTLEAALQDAAPDAASIVVEETGALTRSGFVSLAQLENGHNTAALSAARAARSCD